MSNITIHCPQCRGTEFKVPRKDVQKSDRVTCAKCGHSDTYEKLATSVAKKHVEDAFKDIFKNRTINIKL